MSDTLGSALSDDDLARLKPLRDRLAALRRRSERVGHWAPNKRYVLDFDLPVAEVPAVSDFAANTQFGLFDAEANVAGGAIFLCEEIEVIYSLVGTSIATGQPATYVISAPWRSQFVDFYLRFRDTGSDREWQNDWIPGNFFQSANLGGLILGDEGHVLISGGAAVTASLQIAQGTSLVGTGLSDVVSHQVKVSLIGCQIPLEGA